MALTKLPKNAIGTGAIDASKIEDGTIQNADLAGSLTGTQLASTFDLSSKTVTLPNTSVTSGQLAGSIANNKLSNSTFTIRGTSRALGDSFSLGVNVDWQSVIVADGSTATTGVAGKGYFINTTSAAHTFTLPASASRGDTIALKDYAATFATNKLTIARNGHNIQGVANNSLIDTNRASLVLVYVDSTKGWLYAEEHNVADLQQTLFITATGGTVTTSGDFKIHSFTGDGCFVVSQIGAGTGPSNVDYLVVAGGGGGGMNNGGGGGAGGYRTTFPSPGCNAGSFPISATTYPITVGAGGVGTAFPAGATPFSQRGSNSIFSTITSTGGGGGGNFDDGTPGGSGTGQPGGSGGGARNCAPGGGSGNTPPVSPPQGSPGGGAGGAPAYGSGGGGGAGGAGGSGTPSASGNGGVGLANSITGSPVFYAGGGGGTTEVGSPLGTGGSGGGGAGVSGANAVSNSGTANTGGGGGSSGGEPGSTPGGSGGKGIVIIRYKFQ